MRMASDTSPKVLARVISHDLRHGELTATFKTADTLVFQDALGDIISRVCQVCRRRMASDTSN